MSWELKADRPIYLQLIEQIELMIISGRYHPGEKLPSVRDLAADAAVNPNTMQRALSELERNGLVFAHRTSGRYITEDSSLILKAKQYLAIEEIRALFGKMRALGLDPDTTMELVNTVIKEEVH